MNAKKRIPASQVEFGFLVSLKSAMLMLCLLVLFSCKKDKTPEVVVSEQLPSPTPVVPAPLPRIDSTTSTATIKTRKIHMSTYPSLNESYFDINGDSINDIVLEVTSVRVFGGMLLIGYDVIIKTLNNDTYVLTDSVYQNTVYNCNGTLSHNEVNKAYPRGMVYGDTLKTNDTWRQGSFYLLKYRQDPDTLYCHKHQLAGFWSQYGYRYIGIKHQGKFGWFKLSTGIGQVNIREFAFLN